MSTNFHSVTNAGFVMGEAAEKIEDGLKVADGAHGTVVFGPYLRLDAGIYRITPVVKAAVPLRGLWDVCEEGREFAVRRLAAGGDLILHLHNTRALEFRVIAEGDGFVLRGFRVSSVLLDGEEASAHQLAAISRQLLAERAEVTAVASVARRLAAVGDVVTAAWLRSEAAGRSRIGLQRVWAQLQEIHAPRLGDLSDDLEPPALLAEIQALFAERPFRVLDLNAASWLAEREAVERLGYSWDAFEATKLGGSLTSQQRTWQTEVHDEPMFAAMSEFDLGFQSDLARGLGMTAYCPVSGKRLTSNHGFPIFEYDLPITFYRFEGVEVFYVCTGGIFNSPIMIYLPRNDLGVILTPRFIVNVDFKMLVTVFNANMVHWRTQVKHYLAKPARPAAILSHANLGHFFWNDFSGLAEAVETGALGEVREIVRTSVDYFPVEEVFPESAGLKSTLLTNPSALFGHCLTNQLLPIRFTDMRLSPRTAQRVMDAALRHSPPDPRAAAAKRPLILINLRAHSKIWLDQIDGYANILNRLYDEFGSASAILDGWRDCAETAAAIRTATRPEVEIFDGLSLTIQETLQWCSVIDAYISVVGSGLVLVNWLAGKPGVAHADYVHMEQLCWWSQVRSDAPQPLRPEMNGIENISVEAYANYRVDWRQIYDLLLEALAQGGVRCGVDPLWS